MNHQNLINFFVIYVPNIYVIDKQLQNEIFKKNFFTKFINFKYYQKLYFKNNIAILFYK